VSTAISMARLSVKCLLIRIASDRDPPTMSSAQQQDPHELSNDGPTQLQYLPVSYCSSSKHSMRVLFWVGMSTCHEDIGLLLGASTQKLDCIWMMHLSQHLNLRPEVTQGDRAAPFQDLCSNQRPMKERLVHNPKLTLTCQSNGNSEGESLCRSSHRILLQFRKLAEIGVTKEHHESDT
jgi:hypothetical protein